MPETMPVNKYIMGFPHRKNVELCYLSKVCTFTERLIVYGIKKGYVDIVRGPVREMMRELDSSYACSFLEHTVRTYQLSEEDIRKIADTYQNWRQGKEYEDIQGVCKEASLAEIGEQDYILTPGRYVGIEQEEEDGEPFEGKMQRLTSELSGLFAKSHELEDEIRNKLGAIGYEL